MALKRFGGEEQCKDRVEHLPGGTRHQQGQKAMETRMADWTTRWRQRPAGPLATLPCGLVSLASSRHLLGVVEASEIGPEIERYIRDMSHGA